MSQVLVPEVDGGMETEDDRQSSGAQRVEVAGALTAEKNRLAV